MKDLSLALRMARAKSGKTAAAVSREIGLSRHVLNRLENGTTGAVPSPTKLKVLSDYYKLSEKYLLEKAGYDLKTKATVMASCVTGSLRSRFSVDTGNELYDALGYPASISYDDCRARYKRQDIANRIINGPVDATWKHIPTVSESVAKETVFEKEYELMVKDTRLFYHLRKADVLACLGRFSLIFLGFVNSGDVSTPVENGKGKGLTYLSVIPENRAGILAWDTDPTSKRFGLPNSYQIQMSIGSSLSVTKTVHWSRIIHVAENSLESEVYGIPRLEPIYNRLIGLEKLCGASPEMYWKGARPGYTAQAQQDSVVSQTQLEEIKTEISNYMSGMQRFMYLEGIDIKALAPQVVTPRDHVDVQLMMIAAATGMPLRMLTGSERGELASSQDERAWLKLIEARRITVATELILEPLIDRLILAGTLAKPKDGYTITWEPLVVLEEKDKAEIGNLRAETLAKYVNSVGADSLVSANMFLKRELNYTDEDIEKNEEMLTEDSMYNSLDREKE